jgi:hypothetical protein
MRLGRAAKNKEPSFATTPVVRDGLSMRVAAFLSSRVQVNERGLVRLCPTLSLLFLRIAND